jgi:hypothetical protein
MVLGYQLTQIIHVAAKLRIADHLKDGPVAVRELATLTDSHEDSLYRLLRALAGMGVFAEEEGLRFRLTPAAELLRSGVPGSMRARAEVAGEEWMWRSWGELLHSVRTGETAFDHIYGKGTFDWFSENPTAAHLFDEFLADRTAALVDAVIGAYDFSPAQTVVDLGGGAGVLLTAILRHNRHARGILFDLKHVVAGARTKLDPNVAQRCRFVSGDIFKAVPRGGDLYILKSVLHDWSDARAQAILGTCCRAMAGRGKLLVVEEIVCRPNEPCEAKLSDINMLVRTGGRNRTEKEYRNLLAAGGFKMTAVFPTGGQFSVMEAVPLGGKSRARV